MYNQCVSFESEANLMAIKPIGNNISGVNFTSNNDEGASIARAKAIAFVNMDDAQLKNLAYVASFDKKHKKSSNASALLALPIVAGLSKGILTPGKLSGKTIAAAKTGANWGFGLIVLGVYNSIKKAVASKSPKVQEFESNHPLASLALDLVVLAGALTLGSKGLTKIRAKIVAKLPKEIAATKIMLDKTKINTKYLPKITEHVSKIAQTAPWAVKAGAFVVDNAVYIPLMAGFLKSSNNIKQQHEKIRNNYYQLKEAQSEIAKKLVSETEG